MPPERKVIPLSIKGYAENAFIEPAMQIARHTRERTIPTLKTKFLLARVIFTA
jgi:hypothetical protein